MLKHRFLIIVLLAILTAGMPGGAVSAAPAKKEAKKHKDDKDADKTTLTKKQKRQQKKELKKKEKQEHKQAKADRKKEKADSKKNGLTRLQKKQQRQELKKKQKQERLRLKQEQKQLKHTKVGTPVVKIPAPPPPPPPVVVKKKRELTYPHTIMKPRYRIDILAPMYLDDLVKGGSVTYKDKMPEKALAGISFYEGVSIAADSLKRAGFNIDIYVHDVASAAESAEMLVNKAALDSADIIIGAVPAHDIPVIAEYARKKRINFISVLSASDAGVRGNEYFTMIQPSLKSHCEWIDSDVARKFPGMKPALLYRTTSQTDSIACSYITNDTPGNANFKSLLCNTLPHKKELLALFDTTKPNVVIIPILDIVYADSLLKELSHDFPATHFEVYGMPSWNSIASLRGETTFPNLSVNVTTAFNIDPSVPIAKYVARTFKKDYGGKATEMVYRGYETMYWYANLLKDYGTLFNAKYSDSTAAPFTRFEVKPQWDRNDDFLFNENKHIFVTRYEGGNPKTE